MRRLPQEHSQNIPKGSSAKVRPELGSRPMCHFEKEDSWEGRQRCLENSSYKQWLKETCGLEETEETGGLGTGGVTEVSGHLEDGAGGRNNGIHTPTAPPQSLHPSACFVLLHSTDHHVTHCRAPLSIC